MSDNWLEDDEQTRLYTLRELDNLRRDGLTRPANGFSQPL
nr:Uncharacterised protein [Raoultella sp. NCTC 9187]